MAILPPLSTRHYWWLAFLWTVGIVGACSIPAATLRPIGPALSFDKAIHFGLFAGFGFLWMRVLCPPSQAPASLWRQGFRLVLWGGLFAVGTEVYQYLLPLQRMGDPYDALANGCGLLVSVLAYALYVRCGTVTDRRSRSG